MMSTRISRFKFRVGAQMYGKLQQTDFLRVGEAAAQVPDAEIGVYGGYTGATASTLVLRRA